MNIIGKTNHIISRNQLVDLLKGIAILLMIQVHIIELFAADDIVNSQIGKMLLFLGGPPVAPVFVCFLGYFLAFSKKSNKQLIVRGIKIFVTGMLLNFALNFDLIISVYKGIFDVKLLPYIFGVDILQFAGISVILITLFRNLFEKSIFFVVVGILISAFLGHFLLRFIPDTILLKYISAFFYGSTTWSYFPLFPWLAYPLAGMFFYQLSQKVDIAKYQNSATRLLMFIVFLFFLATTSIYAVSVSSNLQAYYHHGIQFVFWTLVFIMFYSFFVNEADKLIGQSIVMKYLKWLGKNVTIIYIIQWIIIGNIATEVYKTVSSPIHLLFCFVGILIFSSLLMFAYLTIKARIARN